jgi:hypothetical protein
MAHVQGQVRVVDSDVQFGEQLEVLPLGSGHWQATLKMQSAAPESDKVLHRPVKIVTPTGEFSGRVTDHINMFSAGTLITILGDDPAPH